MKVITVRNVPDELYLSLDRLAKRNRRSLQAQVLVLLERARLLDTDESPVERARAMRARLQGRADLGDVVEDIRQERAR